MAYRPDWIVKAEQQMALSKVCLERVYAHLDELNERLATARSDLAETRCLLRYRDVSRMGVRPWGQTTGSDTE